MIMLQGVTSLESSRSIDRASWAGRLLDLGQADWSAALKAASQDGARVGCPILKALGPLTVPRGQAASLISWNLQIEHFSRFEVVRKPSELPIG